MITGTPLTWALVAVSLFNTILMLWLAFSLWLNAQRRSAGVVVAVLGFCLGSGLFISHSAVLLSGELQLTRSNTLWLAVAMVPALLLPYVWYVVLLWYGGYWAPGARALRRRHRPWISIDSLVVLLGFVCLALLGAPFLPFPPGITQAIGPARELIKAPLLGIPLVALGYPLYVLLCVLLSLDALWRPALEDQALGNVARSKARPWLVGATALLLAVAGMVAAAVVWTITNTKEQGYYILTPDRLEVIGRFDLLTIVLVAAVILLVGQAMTSYELFTGRILPRRGLARQWKRAIFLAASYGVLMGGALVWGLEPVYAILLTALLMTAFFSLLGWRAYGDWEQAMRQLRPLVASQRYYDALVVPSPGAPLPPDQFRALCENVLGTDVAYLVPAGPTAAFVQPQAYPAKAGALVPSLGALVETALTDASLVIQIDPGQYAGATWAVPLWRERGLIGVLLIGPRRDGGLYAQEEIEIARATGERLVDGAASLELSQRLMRLQRERMAAMQVLDQQTRRVLHDEVLPFIHTAMLALASGEPPDAVQVHLSDAHRQVSALLQQLPPTVAPEIARLGLVGALRRAVDLEFGTAFASVTWRVEEGTAERAAALGTLAAETLFHATREVVRNAAKHARRAGEPSDLRLDLSIQVVDGQLQITVEDNGPGLSHESAAGQGLALHSTLMAIVGGALSLESVPGRMTRARLALPLPG